MQGQLARSEGRDEMKTSKPFGFDRFSVSDSKLSPSACVFLFFFEIFERYKCRWKWGRGTKNAKIAMGPIFSTSFFWAVKKSSVFFFRVSGAQSSAQKGQKVGESFCDFLRWLHPQKSPRLFFLWGKKLRWKRWCEGENWKLCSRTLFFFGKETLTTAFVPSFYLNLAWRNWYFVVNL